MRDTFALATILLLLLGPGSAMADDKDPASEGFDAWTGDLAGMERAQVQELLDAAHQVCPYSKATRNNVPVELEVIG
jgi:hypothetical protein